MMAIAFDLDTEMLKTTYHNDSYNNAYNDIKNALEEYGFERMQGSVYFGNEEVDAVTCVLAVQELTELYGWFSVSVKDIRMLRIEDDNNLMPAIEKTAKLLRKKRPE